jgi:Sec-independent protein secretion pathway component TatC
MPAGDDLTIILFFFALVFTFGLEAMKAETLARRFGFAAFALGFLVAGLLWIQLKEFWPRLSDLVAPIATNPTSWFIVLMFIAAIFAFSPVKANKSKKSVVQDPLEQDKQPQESVSEPEERIFITASTEYLHGLC